MTKMLPSSIDVAPSPVAVSRRAVLAGTGALIVSVPLASALAQDAAPAATPLSPPPAAAVPAQPPLPGSLRTAPMIDAWVRIDAKGAVTVFSGKSELGQGIRTALLQVAAEQLSVPVSAIRLVTSDTARTANEGYTSGSQSMQDSGTAIAHASAQAREILIKVAAEKLGLGAEQLKAEDGAVIAPDGRSLAYGELVSAELLAVRAQPAATSKLKAPAAYKMMGQSMPRVDIPAKVFGQPAYVHDFRPDGMLHARVVRPPSYGATLASIDSAAIEKLPGVQRVIRDGNFLAVVATREFQAVKAMEALAAAAHWDERETLPDKAQFGAWLKTQEKKAYVIKDQKAAAAPAARTLTAEFHRPYHMHGSIGPSCGVALFTSASGADGAPAREGGQMTVWACSQGMFQLQEAVAELVRLPKNKVRCIHMEGSGCYGHNGADDAAADAAFIAAAMPGKPIRVQWMRSDEHLWEPYGAGMVMRAKASLDASGTIVDWDYEVWTDTHSTRPGGAGSTLVGQHIAAAHKMPPPQPIPQPNGGGDRNIIPLYTIPNLKLIHNYQPHMKLRVSALRGLGAYANVFAIEGFMDELALAAGADPVAFRLKHLADPRALDVVRLAAEKFGWQAGAKLPKGRGQGFAFARYKNTAGYCAIALELAVEHETGRIRLMRAVAAADSGDAVNPDGIKNQIEGGINQSASWTLHEQVEFDRTRVLSRDWSRYPILRFNEAFDSIKVHLINRPGQPFLGTGETSQGPTGAAIANAVFNATGQRMRALPFTQRNVKQAIGV